MKKRFQLLMLMPVSLYTMASAGQDPSYLNFIMAKNIETMSITIDSSCEGSGTPIPTGNITTGFYKNNNYYLKIVQPNQTDSKTCRNNLKPNLMQDNYYGTTTYFPIFIDQGSYAHTVSSGAINVADRNGGYAIASYKDFLPQNVFFSVTAQLKIRWLDGDNNAKITSIIPLTFALGETQNPKEAHKDKDHDIWFVIGQNDNEGNNNATFTLPFGYLVHGVNSGHQYIRNWYTAVEFYDPENKQYFCLSGNLEDYNTIKVNLGYCDQEWECKTSTDFATCK